MTARTKNIKLVVADVDGTLTDGGIYVTENGDHFKKFHARDGMAVKILHTKKIHFGFLSHSMVTNMVTARAKMLKAKFCYVGQQNKLDILKTWCDELGIGLNEVAFIGDDINDLEVIENVGFSACPADATKPILNAVNVVLTRGGGEAAFREWIDEYF